jgi:hypothetical protein
VGERVPLSAACLRWASANCSKATWEGSFRDRNPRTEPVFFFFFLDDVESSEAVTLEAGEARLGEDRLAVSNEGLQ